MSGPPSISSPRPEALFSGRSSRLATISSTLPFPASLPARPRVLHERRDRPPAGPAIRVSSVVTPGFRGQLCRLRSSVPTPRRRARSFFHPSRTGTIYALAPERGAAAAQAPEWAEWRYEGVSLAPRLGRISGMRLLRERGRVGDCSWQADRGLALIGADGALSLVLAVAEPAEAALFLPSPGLYQALLDPAATPKPGVTVRDLLGHGDRDDGVETTIELLPLP